MRQHSSAPEPKWNRRITRRIFPPACEKSFGNETKWLWGWTILVMNTDSFNVEHIIHLAIVSCPDPTHASWERGYGNFVQKPRSWLTFRQEFQTANEIAEKSILYFRSFLQLHNIIISHVGLPVFCPVSGS